MHEPEAFAKLVALFAGDPKLARVQLDVSHPDGRSRKPDGTFECDGLSTEPFADSVGVPRFEVVEEGRPKRRRQRGGPEAGSPPPTPRLRDIGEAWLRHKLNERRLEYTNPAQRAAASQAGKRSVLTTHMSDNARRLAVAGWLHRRCACRRADALLTFRKFLQWSDRESARKASPPLARAGDDGGEGRLQARAAALSGVGLARGHQRAPADAEGEAVRARRIQRRADAARRVPQAAGPSATRGPRLILTHSTRLPSQGAPNVCRLCEKNVRGGRCGSSSN